MKKFMVSHALPKGLTRGELEQQVKSFQKDPDIRGYRSFINLTQGTGICVIEAPSATRLAAWFKANNMPYDSITEVELEGYLGEWVETRTPVQTGV